MIYDLTVVFENGQEFQAKFQKADLQNLTREAAREWLHKEFDTLECEPRNPVGKLILLDTSGVGRARTPGPVVALHLGMSGRILIDGEAAGDPLRYATNREDPAWHRVTIRFVDGGSLALRDPRRLGAVELDPEQMWASVVAAGPRRSGCTIRSKTRWPNPRYPKTNPSASRVKAVGKPMKMASVRSASQVPALIHRLAADGGFLP